MKILSYKEKIIKELCEDSCKDKQAAGNIMLNDNRIPTNNKIIIAIIKDEV